MTYVDLPPQFLVDVTMFYDVIFRYRHINALRVFVTCYADIYNAHDLTGIRWYTPF